MARKFRPSNRLAGKSYNSGNINHHGNDYDRAISDMVKAFTPDVDDDDIDSAHAERMIRDQQYDTFFDYMGLTADDIQDFWRTLREIYY